MYDIYEEIMEDVTNDIIDDINDINDISYSERKVKANETKD